MLALCYAEEGKSGLDRIFYRGNDAYEKGDYREAIAEYEKVLAAGYESGPLYYDLGNAYFKTGDFARAILNYERAGRLIPRDADLKANYRFASGKIADRGRDEEKGIGKWRLLRLYAGNFTINELLIMISGIYAFILVLFTAGMYWPGAKKRVFIAILTLFLFGVFNSLVVWHKADGIGKDAIVISGEAESRYGPFDSATAFFKLHGGLKVRVLNDKADWCKIERSDGKVGWVRKSDLEII
jgi:tetratricopeptide (TPR) repeat protein